MDLTTLNLAKKFTIVSNESVSTKTLGCKGNGISDDTVAFQNAINYASINGKTLYVDNGTYLITKRLDITVPVHIIGANHSNCIIKFKGAFHTETAYDFDYWEEGNACISVRANNVTIENLTLQGQYNKSLNTPVEYGVNGIILHYPKSNGTQYEGAERTQLNQLDIQGFKHGVFIYAGWNRYITCCQFVDNRMTGIKYAPLELGSVGQWAGSGDTIVSCQFVGNMVAGYMAYANFESTVWECVFEYNQRAIYLDNCRDVTFKNCWNEANLDNLYVRGSAKFEGGYNISNTTVDHELNSNLDLIQFEAENSITMCRENTVIFNQVSGIITKGIEIGSEIENLISNPYFEELSGGVSRVTSTTGWDLYGGSQTVSVDTLYNTHYSLHIVASGVASEQGYGARYSPISVIAGTTYDFSVNILTPNRTSIDGGVKMFIAYKNSSGETIAFDNRTLNDLIANNDWETRAITITAPTNATSVIIGFGFGMNGNAYFAEPILSEANGLIKSNVFIKKNTTDSSLLNVYDYSGELLGTLTLTQT